MGLFFSKKTEVSDLDKKSKSKKSQLSLKTKNQSIINMLPILISLIIVPFIIRLKVIALPETIYMLWQGDRWNADFFSYYKGIAVIVTAIAALILFFLSLTNREKIAIEKSRTWKIWYATIGIFMLLVLISSIFSNYTYLSISGAPDRYEGLYVWVSYIILLLYASTYRSEERTDRLLIIAVYFLIVLMGIIGLLQFIGKDIFEMSFMQSLIIPSAYREQIKSFYVAKESVRNIYGTSYHYNYMGSLSPMMLAFSVVLVLFYPSSRIKKWGIAASLISLFLLIASTARSGIIALVLFALTMLIFFGKRLFTEKKNRVVAAILAIALLGFGFVGGEKGLFYRLPSLMSDITAAFVPTSEQTDYHNEIHLQKVDIEDGVITLQTKQYFLKYDPVKEKFWDKDMAEISYSKQTENLWQLDAPYENIQIAIFSVPERKEQYIKIDDGVEVLYFKEQNGNVVATNPRGKEISLEEAPSIGFEGKERLGSSRGYIWSRTLPLIKNKWILGYGADTFLAIFPQGDIYAKSYAYDLMWTVVDKPHNLYIQMAVNFGILSVIVFLVLAGTPIVIFWKRYHREDFSMGGKEALSTACFMSVIAYLGAGLFNDSVLSVAPIFWVMLGLSVALLKKEEQ